ncbi:hypothetical protein QAD02_016844 [Eretmocerus hayati]|uniref:Uncharacterized protein n=1 Tax=Eretmocerus hayati TaxID=131215 RepID=A0ACC2PF35_9HYME|nr:hypothetical protein QAD02_016844 [Eretmocerus hayati]
MVVVQRDVDDIKAFIERDRLISKNDKLISLNDFLNTHKLEVPFKTANEFAEFNVKITDKLREDLKTHWICTSCPSQDLKKRCSRILKDFMTKNAISGYVPENAYGEKKSFEQTNFFKCLLGNIST